MGTKAAVAIVDNVCKKIEAFDGDIIATYDTHFENYMNTQEGKYLPVPHCIKNTEGWKLDSKVQALLGRRKYTPIETLTFGSAELVEYIKSLYKPSETEVVLIGLCTDICVVSNALLIKANFLEIKVSVDASCCARVTPKSHEAALIL